MTPDEQAIHDILKRLETAWNTGDSNGFAAPFQEDSTFIQIFGGQLDGRGAVEASHRHIFDTIYKGSQAEFLLRSIRFLRPDVAVVLTKAQIRFSAADDRRNLDARPTLIIVREQGQWQIAAFQNTRISEMPAEALAASRLAT